MTLSDEQKFQEVFFLNLDPKPPNLVAHITLKFEAESSPGISLLISSVINLY